MDALDEAATTFAIISFDIPPQPQYQQGIGEVIRSSSMVLACPNLLIVEKGDRPKSFDVLSGPILDWLHAPTPMGNRCLILNILFKNSYFVTEFISALYQVIFNLQYPEMRQIFIIFMAKIKGF